MNEEPSGEELQQYSLDGLIERIFTFHTPECEVTIWNSHRLDAPLMKFKPGDGVVIIWNGTETLENGHPVEDYVVYRLMS
jgi:hypothetical protein